MGVADSLRKARNLRPVTDMLNELVKEQERQESFNKVLGIIDGIKNKVDQFQQPPITSTYETAPKPNTNMQSFVGQKTPNATMDDIGNIPKSSMSKGLNVNIPQEKTLPSNKINPFKLQDIGKVTETQTEGEAPGAYETEKYYDEQVYDFMKQFYSDPNNTPEAGQLGMNLLSMIKPKSNAVTISQENTENRTVATDKYGKRTILDEGTGKQEPISEYEKNPDGTLKVYTGPNGQKEYNKITYKNGKKIKEDREQLQFEPKGTNVYVEDKYPEINLANLKQDLAENRSNYDYWDKESKDITKSEKERKKAQEQKSIIMGKIEGVTNGIMSQVNAKAPGFEGVVTGLMGIIGKDAKKIDSTVETYMKGKNPDLIRWAKEILHQRIF